MNKDQARKENSMNKIEKLDKAAESAKTVATLLYVAIAATDSDLISIPDLRVALDQIFVHASDLAEELETLVKEEKK